MVKKFDKNEYTKKYNKEQIIKKQIKFNKNNYDDMILLDYLETVPIEQNRSMNSYFKELIKKDMIQKEKAKKS